MRNNDLLRTLRYILDVGDATMIEIFALGGARIDRPTLDALLARDDDPAFVPCSDALAASFLDGVIVRKRGPSDHPPRPGRLTNNMVLKKLRVAWQLRDDDMHRILASTGFPLSKPELNALFRSEDHPNYRECGDQLLRHFLRGLK